MKKKSALASMQLSGYVPSIPPTEFKVIFTLGKEQAIHLLPRKSKRRLHKLIDCADVVLSEAEVKDLENISIRSLLAKEISANIELLTDTHRVVSVEPSEPASSYQDCEDEEDD